MIASTVSPLRLAIFLSVTRGWRCRLFYGVAPGMSRPF
ncbi:hypothetical protein CW298_3466 [Salmonella enterica subsp. enterica serovar Muenchen]|uniref:Uncharacterized protein n=1 Tax=Salmonella enterica subsp. enterica serovar Uganda str. R8-3404 TaxID=913083 RepID=A0A6C8H5P1_SALET|nr:hypothetical protein LTSEUGA_1608 [Salmonella enterica subsp. enterica serovar Uganda str. R8-3404]PQB17066.1 hypothetical protein CW298_3466 [Salmonella enterica subsp. enterica serovar Muenchen]CEH21098.1 hypothetical protein SMA01_1307 [Salmonella enterica subsp. enterica serovar Manhattan str. 111113]